MVQMKNKIHSGAVPFSSDPFLNFFEFPKACGTAAQLGITPLPNPFERFPQPGIPTPCFQVNVIPGLMLFFAITSNAIDELIRHRDGSRNASCAIDGSVCQSV
jgi:hypothetical protein